MLLHRFRRFRSFQRGFSLIEMLVAVMFIGILTAGMLRIYSVNLTGFQRVNDSIASQRRGRWALASLQDDVSSIGYFAYVGFNAPGAGDFSVVSGTQEPLMILPSPTTVYVTGPDLTNPSALVRTSLTPSPDELQYVSDIALPIQATLAAITTSGLNVNRQSGALEDLRDGDIVSILDDQFEQFYVAAAGTGGNNVVADLVKTDVNQNINSGAYPVIRPGGKTHFGAPPLAFYRPKMVTRYSIQALPWDPSNSAITIPCLVRQQTPYPIGGAAVAWGAVPVEVIAENIEGFRVDISFDGGGHWTREGATSWDDMAGRINSALAPLGATGTPTRDINNPLWFRTYPFLIRMDVVSRSAVPKAEAGSPVAAYVRRTQTLMVSPRNFGLPL